MSRIPFATITSADVPSIAAPPAISLDAAAAISGGAALEGLGKGLNVAHEMATKLVEARDSVNVSNALVDANDKLDSFRRDLDRDPDTAGREKKFADKAAEVRQAAFDSLGRSDAIEHFQIRFNTLARPMQNQVRQQARDEELQKFKLDLGDGLDKLATQSVFARTDQERIALQTEADRQIVDAVRTQRLTAVQAHQLKHAYLGKVDAALAGELVRTNPGAAIAALGDPAKYQYLDAAQRVQLRGQATTRAESLGVQARAELRADAGELIADMTRSPLTGQMPDERDVQAILKRAGPKSAIAVRVQKTWDFYNQVAADTEGKTIPQLAEAVTAANRGSRPPDDANLRAADAAMKLTAEERALYTRHLGNVVGPGGVSNPDGTRSTLYQTTAEIDGRTYNIPTVWDGKIIPPDQAIERARAQGLNQFPSYPDQATAEARYQQLHGFMEKDKPTATPQDLHRARVLQAALQQRLAARNQDPVAYAVKSYPTIGEQLAAIDQIEQGNDESAKAAIPDMRARAWGSLLDAQRREGVPEHKLALLTREGADALKARFLTAEGQGRADLVDSLRTQYGDQWSRVASQLWEGKPAPGDVQVIAALPQGANLPKVEVAEANKLSEGQAKEILGGKTIGAVDEAVRTVTREIAPSMRSAPDGPQFLATYQTQIEKLARLYMVRGESNADTAARRAADRLFFDHWEVVDGVGGATVRVPKVQGEPVVPASAVRDMQRTVIDALPKIELADPGGLPGTTAGQRKDMLVRTVRSSGYWMTTADDRGMVLMAGPGLPVMLPGGRPLIVPFESAGALAAINQAQSNLGRRELVNQGGEPAGDAPIDLGSDPAPHHAIELLPPEVIRSLGRMGEGVLMRGVPLK